jgi:hypothetical protein
MAKYKNVDDLKKRIENIVKRETKHYMSDWTDYDRPKLERCIRSDEKKDKKLVLLARTCGTYLLYMDGIEENPIYRYYVDTKYTALKYYDIDIDKLTVTERKVPYMEELKKAKKTT